MEKMKKLKVALGDLRHQTTGRNFVFMPLGISYIAAYLLQYLGKENVDVRFFDDPTAMLEDLLLWKPDVVALSHYCWNSEISSFVFRQAKKFSPEVVCVAGGPEFPLVESESNEFLQKRPEIDFFVFLEGEVSFAKLMEEIMRNRIIASVKSEPPAGVMSISPLTGRLVSGGPREKLEDLDSIPSPYLTGLMDIWFNGLYAPSIETSRGCPFTCGFCYAGQKRLGNGNKVAAFSIDRIKAELEYIASRMKDHPHILLSICDSNFGMYERDEIIAEQCRALQEKYGWPNAFDVTTGKMNYDRILRIASCLGNKMHVTCSVQSLNPNTLDVIKRKNLPLDEYREIQMEIKERKMLSIAELIMPLPEETKETFLQGIKTIIDIGVEQVVPYTTMLLKGTFLSSSECREKYSMVSKFRMLPRQFGKYAAEKCFEIEEVCVSTNTMSFEDYLELRGFALISAFFSGELFDVVHRHLSNAGLNRCDYYLSLWNKIKSGNSPLSEKYMQFICETKSELFDSPLEIYQHFSIDENYSRLLTGELGDNLIRKYITTLITEKNVASIELAYAALIDISAPLEPESLLSLVASKKWMLYMRNLEPVFNTETYKNVDEIQNFDYQIDSWLSDEKARGLAYFKTPTSYRFSYDKRELERILEQSHALYGNDKAFRVGKTLINWSIRNFFCKCSKA